MLTLYFAPGSCSLTVHIALEEAGLAFESHKLDLAAGDQRSSDFLAVNPHGRVPALITPGGLLTEAPAVLAFVADLAPEKRLLPGDAFGRAKAVSHLCYFSGTVHGNGFAGAFRPYRFAGEDTAAQEAIRAQSRKDIVERYFPEIEAMLDGRAWVMDHLTVADLYPLVFRRWGLRMKLDMSAFPNLTAHTHRLAQRPTVQAVLAREGITLEA